MKYNVVIKTIHDGGVRRETTFDDAVITASSWGHAVVLATAHARQIRGFARVVVVYNTTNGADVPYWHCPCQVVIHA